MSVRMAAVAGQFYESSPRKCEEHIENLLPSLPLDQELPARIAGGVVPHAGWVFSGELAALTFSAIRQQEEVDTFVIFGAVHRAQGSRAMLYDRGQWGTPLGTIDVDEELAKLILGERDDLVIADTDSHALEHSIEVQVPIIQHLYEEARIVPILTPPSGQATQVGRAVAEAVGQSERRVVFIGSTDLTHYGPSYMFTPQGTGPEAIQWAKEHNDRFFLDLALRMEADNLVDAARSYGSACGAGAVAATIGAARQMGAEKGYLLGHTTSAEVMRKKFNQHASDSVGYASIVYG